MATECLAPSGIEPSARAGGKTGVAQGGHASQPVHSLPRSGSGLTRQTPHRPTSASGALPSRKSGSVKPPTTDAPPPASNVSLRDTCCRSAGWRFPRSGFTQTVGGRGPPASPLRSEPVVTTGIGSRGLRPTTRGAAGIPPRPSYPPRCPSLQPRSGPEEAADGGSVFSFVSPHRLGLPGPVR